MFEAALSTQLVEKMRKSYGYKTPLMTSITSHCQQMSKLANIRDTAVQAFDNMKQERIRFDSFLRVLIPTQGIDMDQVTSLYIKMTTTLKT